MSSNNDYIAKMVQETFNEVESSDNILAFPIDSNTDSNESQLAFDFNTLQGQLDRERHCLCLEVGNVSVEIPVNWGPFKNYDFSQIELNISIDHTEDSDHFLETLSLGLEQDINALSLQIQANIVYFKFIIDHSVQDIAA